MTDVRYFLVAIIGFHISVAMQVIGKKSGSLEHRLYSILVVLDQLHGDHMNSAQRFPATLYQSKLTRRPREMTVHAEAALQTSQKRRN